jgi:hypothetical protein
MASINKLKGIRYLLNHRDHIPAKNVKCPKFEYLSEYETKIKNSSGGQLAQLV